MINVFAGADIREKYDYSKPRACVGLCFIRKLAGQPPVEYPPRARERTPCVGMCFRTRSSGGKVAMRMKERKNRKPCIGLCFIARLKKTSPVSTHEAEETVTVQQEEDISEGDDFEIAQVTD